MPTKNPALTPKNKAAWKEAFEDENLETIQALHEEGFGLEWGMEVDCSHGKMTGLQLACFNDWKDGALWLIERGAKVAGLTKSKSSALAFAVLGGDEEVIEALLKADASNINVVSVFGVSPLHSAVVGDPEIARLLLAHGADPTVKNDEGKDALDLARESNGSEMQEVVHSAWSTQQVLLDRATPVPAQGKRPRRV